MEQTPLHVAFWAGPAEGLMALAQLLECPYCFHVLEFKFFME